MARRLWVVGRLWVRLMLQGETYSDRVVRVIYGASTLGASAWLGDVPVWGLIGADYAFDVRLGVLIFSVAVVVYAIATLAVAISRSGIPGVKIKHGGGRPFVETWEDSDGASHRRCRLAVQSQSRQTIRGAFVRLSGVTPHPPNATAVPSPMQWKDPPNDGSGRMDLTPGVTHHLEGVEYIRSADGADRRWVIHCLSETVELRTGNHDLHLEFFAEEFYPIEIHVLVNEAGGIEFKYRGAAPTRRQPVDKTTVRPPQGAV